MEGLGVMLFPALLILFAVGMERFEARLARLTVPEQEVTRFLDGATLEEVAALADRGMPDALERFHRRMGHEDDLYPDEHIDKALSRRAS
ncbi:MAG: hypothetical protein HOQ24_01645 [Mycobacteriaceae bacterium]|nr:hypothetical protein [Mycobacteriaceae bacterium]